MSTFVTSQIQASINDTINQAQETATARGVATEIKTPMGDEKAHESVLRRATTAMGAQGGIIDIAGSYPWGINSQGRNANIPVLYVREFKQIVSSMAANLKRGLLDSGTTLAKLISLGRMELINDQVQFFTDAEDDLGRLLESTPEIGRAHV